MPYFQTGDVKAATLHLKTAKEFLSDYGVSQSRVWEPGVTCITIAANIAETAVLGCRGCFPDSVLGFVPFEAPSDAYFVKYLLDVHRDLLASTARGTTQDNLSLEKLLAHRFRIPASYDYRTRIVDILRGIDDLIENNRRRIQVLEEMAKAIYREWFVRYRYPGHEADGLVESPLGPIPEGWEVKTLDHLASIGRDTVDAREVPADYPAVGLEHIPRRQLTLDDWGCAGELQSRKTRFRAGDILFGKIRPYFHKVSVAPLEGICSTDAIVIRPRDPFWGLVAMTVSSAELVAHATQTSSGTKMPRADWKVLGQYPLAVPPEPLAEHLTDLIRTHLETANTLMFSTRTLAVIRDLLLPKLVTGQIDVSHLDLDDMTEASA